MAEENPIASLVRPVTQYQIGDGVPWPSWVANMYGASSEFRSFDVISSVERAMESYNALHTRIEDRDYTKDELVKHLYAVCERFNIDRVIAYAQITAESSFNPKATGAFCVLGTMNKKCGAGIAQFIPATGRAYGLQIDREVDARFDPIASLNAYGAYMADLLSQFNGDYIKALAAYNAGPGAVLASVKRNGDGWLAGMPSETQVYVVRILGERATTDKTILQSVQQTLEKGATTKIGVWDLLTSELGPDLIKRWGLMVIGVGIIFAVIVAAGFKAYKRYA